MRGKRYVHSEERKFKTNPPPDGELVAFRLNGHKTYCAGVWDDESKCVLSVAGSIISVQFLSGWMPLKEEAHAAFNKHARKLFGRMLSVLRNVRDGDPDGRGLRNETLQQVIDAIALAEKKP